MDGMALLRNDDHLEVLVAQAVIEDAMMVVDDMQKNLARAIRNEITEAFNG